MCTTLARLGGNRRFKVFSEVVWHYVLIFACSVQFGADGEPEPGEIFASGRTGVNTGKTDVEEATEGEGTPPSQNNTRNQAEQILAKTTPKPGDRNRNQNMPEAKQRKS